MSLNTSLSWDWDNEKRSITNLFPGGQVKLCDISAPGPLRRTCDLGRSQRLEMQLLPCIHGR